MTNKMARLVTYHAIATIFLIALMSHPTEAEYIVTGTIRGQVCSNYLAVSKCHMVDVDAVEGDGGQLYTVTQRFKTVTSGPDNSGTCWIRLPSKSGPHFFTKTQDGKYKKINTEYLVFDCKNTGD
jgi:hypothetical protein